MHQHGSRKFFEQLIVGGRVAGAEAAASLLDHLLSLCPECRQTYEELVAEAQRGGGRSRGEIVARVLAELAGSTQELDRLREQAEDDFAELSALPAPRRRERVRRAISRCRSPFLVKLLLAESRKHLLSDPYAALDLAECAQLVAFRLPANRIGGTWCMTEIARSEGHCGNAMRAVGNYREAEPRVERALYLFEQQGNGDPMVHAELVGFLGSLRLDQVRPREAEQHFQEAASLYAEVNDVAGMAREQIKLASLYRAALGEPEKAHELLRDLLTSLAPEEHSDLLFLALHDLAESLSELGCHLEAREVLLGHATLYERYGEPWAELRRRWVSGKIAAGLGEEAKAERLYSEARRGFEEAGQGFDAALVGMDQALLYLDQNEPAKLTALADDLRPILLGLALHRDALAAPMLFQQALRRGTVTREVVEATVQALRNGVRGSSERPS